MCTWYAEDAVPKMKPFGKVLRFNKAISGVMAPLSVTVMNKESRAMRGRSTYSLYAISA